MKLMFASDIHGSAKYCRKMVEIYEKGFFDKLILLGDLLYHGPRNDLPEEYNPKEVIRLLNHMKQEILCVRGNCEAEVDQMVLEFPVLADYMTIFEAGRMFFVTHGHKFNLEQMPMLNQGDVLIHGHTHIQAMERTKQCIYLNPGSVSIPKNGNKNSYMTYENGRFVIRDFEENEIASLQL